MSVTEVKTTNVIALPYALRQELIYGINSGNFIVTVSKFGGIIKAARNHV